MTLNYSYSETEFPIILLYHRISNAQIDNQYLSVSPENFEEHLSILTHCYHILPLHDLLLSTAQGHIPRNAVSITFDDGYADNLHNALPLLEKYHCHATIFVAAGMVDDALGFWYDVLEDIIIKPHTLPPMLNLGLLKVKFPLTTPEERFVCHEALVTSLRSASPRIRKPILHEILSALGYDPQAYETPYPLLSSKEVRELAASPWIELGGHTLMHPVLSQLSHENQYREIRGGALLLENLSGKKPRLFAYPFGNPESFNADTCKIVEQCGFEAGIANYQGSVDADSDRWHIPRRLVRNWDRVTFKNWLTNAHKGALEERTLAGREEKLMSLLRSHMHPQYDNSSLAPLEGIEKGKCSFRITHVNTCMGRGGAAKVTELLLRAQLSEGHEARAVVAQNQISDPAISTFDPGPNRLKASQIYKEGLLDYHFSGSHTLLSRNEIQNADILHLHNLHGGYFNPFSLPLLARCKPVVWTLHDMQALTGHCAHALDCQRWRTGCGLCPYLDTYPAVMADNTHRLWRDKKMLYDAAPLQLAVPSRWLSNMLPESILSRHPSEVIPNGIDIRLFRPMEKIEARRKLGLPEQGLIIGNAAAGGPLTNVWKGGTFALAVMKALREFHHDTFFVGRGTNEASDGPGLRLLPYTQNEEDMRVFYTALDFLLYPSIADNYPLALLEAQACGTPVLAFNVGGIPEIVEDGESGIIVPNQDTNALIAAALRLADNSELIQRLGINARKKAEREFDVRLMSKRYMQLYDEVNKSFLKRRASSQHLSSTAIPPSIGQKYIATARICGLLKEETTYTSVSTTPVSRQFGLDRGTAIDRVYIENFLRANRTSIRGRVLEIADNSYTCRFGSDVTKSDVFSAEPGPGVTMVGNISDAQALPANAFDCIIFTQTLQFIYDFRLTLKNLTTALKPGGSLLLTVPGISQISRYDMDRWGDFWRFTDHSIAQALQETQVGCEIEVAAYGNVGIAKAFLDGLAAEEVDAKLFETNDNDYQLIICARLTTPYHGKILDKGEYAMPDTKDWATINVPDNMHGLRAYAEVHRYGHYRVLFQGMTIFCHDLLSFYMAGKDIFLHGIYDFTSDNPTPFVIDGGGHIGLSVLRIKQQHPEARIIVFEPDPESLALLHHNIATNRLQGIEIVPMGLSDTDAEMAFNSGKSDGSTLYGENSDTTIKVTKLSRHLKRTVDFLKLNIEGAELSVLQECGKLLQNVKSTVIEYHGFPHLGDRLHEILSILHNNGFRYIIHDFDNETNANSKPPFDITCNTRYFLLVAGYNCLPVPSTQQ